MSKKRKQSDQGDGAVALAEMPTMAGDQPTADAAMAGGPSWVDGPPVEDHGRASMAEAAQQQPPADAAEPGATDGQGKSWGDPYKSIFSCPEQGFELGEHRRFKQRVFLFDERPSDEVIAELKANGFTYRGAEKAWTVPATPASRVVTDDLARKWAGPNYVQGVER